MYFRVSVVSEVGTKAPKPLEVTQPKTSLRYAYFIRSRQSLEHISHLISSKYQIIDHSLS